MSTSNQKTQVSHSKPIGSFEELSAHANARVMVQDGEEVIGVLIAEGCSPLGVTDLFDPDDLRLYKMFNKECGPIVLVTRSVHPCWNLAMAIFLFWGMLFSSCKNPSGIVVDKNRTNSIMVLSKDFLLPVEDWTITITDSLSRRHTISVSKCTYDTIAIGSRY